MFGRKTVDSVIKQFKKAHDDLAVIEAGLQNEVQDLEDQRRDVVARKGEAQQEADRAKTARTNLAGLLPPEASA